MTYLERKLNKRCTRCQCELPDDAETNQCEPHRVDGNARSSASQRKKRAIRRVQVEMFPRAARSRMAM